jgi:hypothetical protein
LVKQKCFSRIGQTEALSRIGQTEVLFEDRSDTSASRGSIGQRFFPGMGQTEGLPEVVRDDFYHLLAAARIPSEAA